MRQAQATVGDADVEYYLLERFHRLPSPLGEVRNARHANAKAEFALLPGVGVESVRKVAISYATDDARGVNGLAVKVSPAASTHTKEGERVVHALMRAIAGLF